MVPTVVDPIGQKCKIAKIQDGGGRHLGFQKNVYNFRKDKAILTKFHQHIPGTNCRRPYRSKMQNCQNPRWRRPPSWISENVNNFRKDQAIITKFHQLTPGTNCYRPHWSQMQNC